MSTIKVNTITNTAGNYSVPVTSINRYAYATMYYSVNDAAGSVNVADSSAYGSIIPFNQTQNYANITPNTGTSRWTHTYTGTYQVTCHYRQNSGGDIWSVMAVTKNGNSSAVAISSRVGSGDSRMDLWTMQYPVDDTGATYQLQQWATTTKTVGSDFTGGNPGWANYPSLVGNTTGDVGRMITITVFRVGD
jgi:hypothetical protein